MPEFIFFCSSLSLCFRFVLLSVFCSKWPVDQTMGVKGLSEVQWLFNANGIYFLCFSSSHTQLHKQNLTRMNVHRFVQNPVRKSALWQMLKNCFWCRFVISHAMQRQPTTVTAAIIYPIMNSPPGEINFYLRNHPAHLSTWSWHRGFFQRQQAAFFFCIHPKVYLTAGPLPVIYLWFNHGSWNVVHDSSS